MTLRRKRRKKKRRRRRRRRGVSSCATVPTVGMDGSCGIPEGGASGIPGFLGAGGQGLQLVIISRLFDHSVPPTITHVTPMCIPCNTPTSVLATPHGLTLVILFSSTASLR